MLLLLVVAVFLSLTISSCLLFQSRVVVVPVAGASSLILYSLLEMRMSALKAGAKVFSGRGVEVLDKPSSHSAIL